MEVSVDARVFVMTRELEDPTAKQSVLPRPRLIRQITPVAHRSERLPNLGRYDRSRSVVAALARCLPASRYGCVLPNHRMA